MVLCRKKILVVEDDPDALRLLTYVLKEAGFQAVPAHGGADALRKVDQQDFDLILTDLAMPEVSGVEVIERVRRNPQKQHIPILAVTAFTWDSIAHSAGEVGCDGYISKPVRPKELVRRVEECLEDHETKRNETRPD